MDNNDIIFHVSLPLSIIILIFLDYYISLLLYLINVYYDNNIMDR